MRPSAHLGFRLSTLAGIASLIVACIACGCGKSPNSGSGAADSSSGTRARALKLLREGEPREALDLLETIRRPGNPDDTFLLGEAALKCGRYARAKQAYREVLSVRPGDLAASTRLARIAFLEGSYREARKQLDWILARSPDEVEARELRSRIRLRLGDLNGAAADARRWSELAPRDAEPVRILGSVQLLRGDPDGAILVLKRAVELDPSHLPSRLDLAKAYQKGGQRRLSEETLREAGRLEREQRRQAQQRAEASYHRLRALQLLQNGKAREALRSFEDALSHDPKNPILLREAGEAALAEGDLSRAREYLDGALRLAPSDAAVRRVRGEVLLASGDAEGSLVDLLEAARLDPSDPAPHQALARAYDALHRPEAEKERELAQDLEQQARPPAPSRETP